MSILQKPDCFGGGDYALATRSPYKFGNGRHGQIFSGVNFVALAHDRRVFHVADPPIIDLGPVFVISNDARSCRPNPGHERGSVYIGGGGINRMMIAKSDALLAELPKGRAIFLGHQIGTHSVPDNNQDLPRRRSGHLRERGVCAASPNDGP